MSLDDNLHAAQCGIKLDQCEDCGHWFDVEDGFAYYGDDNDEGCVCQECRDVANEAQREDHRLDDPRHGQAEWLNY